MNFLPGGFPAIAMAAKGPPGLTFLQAAEDTANLTTYSFATQNIGAGDSTRRVVVVVTWSGGAAVRTLSSATIGGVAATIHVQQSGASANSGGVAIISLLVAAGTTATVAFTLSGAADRAAIAVYRAVSESVATPHATATDGGGTSGLWTTTINIPANGWVVSGSSVNTGAGASFTWTGATERLDTAYGDAAGVYRTGASQELLAVQTGRTISAQCSDTAAVNGALAAMSWG